MGGGVRCPFTLSITTQLINFFPTLPRGDSPDCLTIAVLCCHIPIQSHCNAAHPEGIAIPSSLTITLVVIQQYHPSSKFTINQTALKHLCSPLLCFYVGKRASFLSLNNDVFGGLWDGHCFVSGPCEGWPHLLGIWMKYLWGDRSILRGTDSWRICFTN